MSKMRVSIISKEEMGSHIYYIIFRSTDITMTVRTESDPVRDIPMIIEKARRGYNVQYEGISFISSGDKVVINISYQYTETTIITPISELKFTI